MTGTRDILFFLCLNDRGGTEISMLKLAEGLRQKGRPVRLAVYGTKTYLARDLGFNGEITDLGCRRTVSAVLPLFRLLLKKRPALLMSALTHTNIAALLASGFIKIPVIVTEHGLDGIDQSIAHPFFAFVVRTFYNRASALVAVSDALADRWRTLVTKCVPVTTIYNPIVDRTDMTAPPAAHEWLTKKTVPVIMGIGRLKPEKNFASLIDAFAILQNDKEAHLIILGEGEDRALLEKKIADLKVSDKIVMPGFSLDIRSWLSYADLLVMPSRREGFGNVLVEAMACGVPVIAYDCPFGPAEILQHGKYGTLVPLGDMDALAQAMRAQLERTPDVSSLHRRALDFTARASIDAYKSLIDKLSSPLKVS